MEPVALITEIKPLFSSQYSGEQRQRSPFAQGQLFQATVTEKSAANLFTIDINGQHITAESTTPLQIGQQLLLRIMSLMPRMELQVVNQDLVNSRLNNVLPLLGKEPFSLPQLAALADDADLMAQLRPETRASILLFAGRQAADVPSSPLPVPAVINQLADLLIQKTLPAPEHNAQIPLREIVALLQGEGRTAPLDLQNAATISRLVDLFSRSLTDRQTLATDQSAAARPAAVLPRDSGPILELLTTLAGFKTTAADSPLPAQLLALHQAYTSLPVEHPLQQLLSFLVQTTRQHALPFLAHSAGEQLGERLSRLGLNMEQLLAENKPEAAMRTLKFALLELAQQAEAGSGKSGAVPAQLGQLLELYQLVQYRLANEALIFLPLPFLFLQHGYALITRDHIDSEEDAANKLAKQAHRTVTLHLRLESLGNLRIDIQRQEDKITLRFLAEDADKARFIAACHQELEQWFTSGKLASAQFLVGAQDPIKSLLEKILPGEAGIINTKV
jgi:Flagellar hook-length control protein FliK.